MDILAAQYTKLYTRKFRVYYSDLVGVSSSQYRLKVFTFPRNFEVLFTKMWLRQTFAGASTTSLVCYGVAGINLASGSPEVRDYATLNLLSAALDYSGTLEAAQNRVNTAVTPNGGYISNQSADNEYWLLVTRNAISGPPALTAGYLDLWVTLGRYP